jgi:hypothetical protein
MSLKFIRNGVEIDYIEEARNLLDTYTKEQFLEAMEQLLGIKRWEEMLSYEDVNLSNVVT